MKRLPKKLKVGAYTIKVLIKDKVIVGGKERDGCYETGRYIIQIRKGASPQRKRMILLHEALHCLIDIYKIPVKNEETVVAMLDDAILAFLLDNNIGFN